MNSIGTLLGKNILFLQGPMGTFFKTLDNNFRKKGAKTYKIGFNMGDQFYANKDNYIAFSDEPELWPFFIENFLKEQKIDKIFLFGDCRFYQKHARKIAYRLGVDVYVFEEGYVRPHYITLEKFGVNGFSYLSKDPKFYFSLEDIEADEPQHAKQSKIKMILSASIYFAVSNLFDRFKYKYYKHHRDFSAMKELFYGIRGILRKGLYYFTEKKYLSLLSGTLSKQYYFIPLQTHNDFQILEHSNYRSIEKFIIEVLESFARNGPKEFYLVFKHHPVDRGRKNYKLFIMEQASLLNIDKRILVVNDVHLPSCLKNALAVVTINSTVGLSAIGHEVPTIVLGGAIYDIKGLSSKGIGLKRFWHQYKKPDKKLYIKFEKYIIQTTQLNGSFYGKIPKELKN